MAGRLAAGLLKNHVLIGQVVPSNLQNALKVQVGYSVRASFFHIMDPVKL